uniref:Uncharacterized protein n=1 Tax=Oryza brachyantha TaxID=4533 RepID=J3LUT9_ORYBR
MIFFILSNSYHSIIQSPQSHTPPENKITEPIYLCNNMFLATRNSDLVERAIDVYKLQSPN